MSESKKTSPLETCSTTGQESTTTEEVSSTDSADVSKENLSEPTENEGDDTTEPPESIQETEKGDEAQQYERFENQMLFQADTPESKNEALLIDLVENKKDIKKIDPSKVVEYASAINSTFRNAMIQGVANRSVNFDRMILIGDACSALKTIVKSSSQGWEDFIKDHFGPELLSTIGTYMRLAKITNVKNHSYLGKDRILKVHSTGNKIQNLPTKSNDPISDILSQLKIVPINSLFDDVPLFNKRVDAALFAHKIEINGISVKHQSVIDLASTKFNFKNANKHLKAMLHIKDNSDNPNAACQKYLDNILENNGIYNGSSIVDDSDKPKGEDDFINTIKESYAAIRTSFLEGKELSAEEKGEIKTLLNYLNGLIA